MSMTSINQTQESADGYLLGLFGANR